MKQIVSYVKGHTDLIHCIKELTIEIVLRKEERLSAVRNTPTVLHNIMSRLQRGLSK